MANSLYLIGSSHIEFTGARRLRKIVDYIKPSAILAEVNDITIESANKDSIAVNQASLDPEKRALLLDEMERLGYNRQTMEAIYFGNDVIADAFMYIVPREYGQENNIPVSFFDSQPHLDRSQGLPLSDEDNARFPLIFQADYMRMSIEELAGDRHYSLTLEQIIDEKFSKFLPSLITRYNEATIAYALEVYKRNFVAEMVQRDKEVEPYIRQLRNSHSPLVYIGGSVHFKPYPFRERSLYDRLLDLDPILMMLPEADTIK